MRLRAVHIYNNARRMRLRKNFGTIINYHYDSLKCSRFRLFGINYPVSGSFYPAAIGYLKMPALV